MWTEYLDVRANVVVVVDQLYQQLTTLIDDKHNDNDVNQLEQYPKVPHKNRSVLMVASDQRMTHEQLETFVYMEWRKRRENRMIINRNIETKFFAFIDKNRWKYDMFLIEWFFRFFFFCAIKIKSSCVRHKRDTNCVSLKFQMCRRTFDVAVFISCWHACFGRNNVWKYQYDLIFINRIIYINSSNHINSIQQDIIVQSKHTKIDDYRNAANDDNSKIL